ncbi:MAG TPA: hypothetical protein VNZ49_06300 [Bacteroidia bacterium]|jgi:hypothetical protein|nr:hypothetical protein [Bacteroidia bacterium]
MNKTDPTFELIKALDKGEKRLFKLQTQSMGESKNYLKVFDALDTANVYLPEKLKQKIKGGKINLSYEKNYLHKQILKTLRNTGNENLPMQFLSLQIAEVEVLYAKKLFKQALEKIREAKDIAWKFDYFGLYLELLSIQRRILLVTLDVNIKEQFELIEDETNKAMQTMSNLQEFVLLNNKLYLQSLNKGGTQGKVLDNYRKSVSIGIMSDEKKALCPSAKLLFHSHKMGYYFFINDFKMALKHNNESIRVYESYNGLMLKNPQNFIPLVTNSIIIECQSGLFKEAKMNLDKLRNIVHVAPFKSNRMLCAHVAEAILMLEIGIATQSGAFENISVLTREMTQGLQQYKKDFSEYGQRVINYHLALLNYLDGKPQVTIKILNELVNAKQSSLAQDYYTYSVLFLALMHFEKGNYELIHKLLSYIKTTNNDFVTLITVFLSNKKFEDYNAREQKTFFQKFRTEAEEFLIKNKLLIYFPLLQWLDKRGS